MQYIRSPGYFVVQYESDIPKIEQLNIEINLKCGGSLPRPPTDRHLQQGETHTAICHVDDLYI